jgi:hypothetical protein
LIANEVFYVAAGAKADQAWDVRIKKNSGAYSLQSNYACQSTTLTGINYLFNAPCKIPSDAVADDEYRFQFYPTGDDPDTSADTFYYPLLTHDPIVVGVRNGDIYLGQAGSEILLTPYGLRMVIKTNEIARSGRTAGGKLVTDVAAIKYQFELPYDAIDGDKLDEIVTLYDLHADLTLKAYLSDSAYFLSETGLAPVVKMSPIDRERLIMLGTGLWTGVSLTLEEV